WIVIQQRIDGSQSFNQNWNTYKTGFGIYNKNFWFGLEKMHRLTTWADYRLRFEVLINGVWHSDEYDHFTINSELEKYSLFVSGYIGDYWDVLNYPSNRQNGMKFSTPDQDNDVASTNCALEHSAGNWFNWCYCQNLNHVYGSQQFSYGYSPTVTYCRMMVKRNA
ncbi:hypothetical protein HELRODRAFT_81270, partial [Helobdella robusta]|uniref:Fibrinogen C-terminal domain-containing protein n=1 Tax=Helobdella robusta TaxID=6412 RepID=T1G4C3_HELRO